MSKKLTYLLCFVLLAHACGKGEYVQAPGELVLRPTARLDTKADADPELDGNSLGEDNKYVVYLSASSSQHPTFLTGQLYSFIDESDKWQASSTPGTASPVYWPVGGVKVDFLALACKSVPDVYSALAPQWDSSTSADGVTIAGWDTYANQYDVLYASRNQQTSANGNGVVNMEFRHSMALLAFTAKCSDANAFTLNSIVINGLGYSGTFSIDNTHTELTGTWGTLATGDKLLYKLDGTTDSYAFPVPTTAAQCALHLLVPQQPSRSITINYSLRNSEIPSFNYTIYLPRTVWKAGYKYTYALDFNLQEIKVTPTVSAWIVED